MKTIIKVGVWFSVCATLLAFEYVIKPEIRFISNIFAPEKKTVFEKHNGEIIEYRGLTEQEIRMIKGEE